MRKVIRICFAVLIILSFISGCTQRLPRSEYPIQFKKNFNASFDRTWDAVLDVVKNTKGTLITKDKSSGLVVFSRYDSIFFNVLIKDTTDSNITSVYFKPLTKSGPYMRGYAKGGKMLRDIDVVFFENVEKRLTRGN